MRRKHPVTNSTTLSTSGKQDFIIAHLGGGEHKLTICDMVVCRELRFMLQSNRLIVMISHSQVGLYMVGNSGEMEKKKARVYFYLFIGQVQDATKDAFIQRRG
jgi:hypothetical protein